MVHVVIGADHAGVALKTVLVAWMKAYGVSVDDVGTHTCDAIDYTDVVPLVTGHVLMGAVGILVCGSGIGMSIAANRYKGIRAALCQTDLMAQLSRQHNDANILVLGSRLLDTDHAIICVKTFLDTPFEGGRHQRRVDKIDGLLGR